MIPVKINLRTSRDRSETFSYEIANDSFLTPLLLNITVFNTITSSERVLGESTITIKGAINVKGQEPIEFGPAFLGYELADAGGRLSCGANQFAAWQWL